MNDIASLIEVAYCLPEKFNSLECGACSLEEIETKKWADSQTAWYLEPNVRIYDSIKRLGYNVLNLALSDHDKSEIFNISMHDGFGYLESSGTNDSLKKYTNYIIDNKNNNNNKENSENFLENIFSINSEAIDKLIILLIQKF